MDLRSLNTFIQVAEMKSFTRAAERLGYSQPTVSFQIRNLESELNLQLFERIGHTVSLTDAGRDVLDYAQRICRLSQEMILGADERRIASGVIRLAMADSLCAPLVVKHFGRFRAEYPNVSLHVTTAGTGELFRLLDHNEADLVCTLDSHIYNTNYIIAHEEKIGVHFVAASSHPLAREKNIPVERLLKEAFMMTEKNMSYNRLLGEKLARKSLEIQPVLEMSSPQLISSLVAEGTALSFLPDYATEAAVLSGRLVRLDVAGCDVDLWMQLLYHRGKWMSMQIQAVLNHLSGIRLSG